MWLLLASAFAGDHRELCEKIAASEVVLEVQFTPTGTYPEKHRKNDWAPPPESLAGVKSSGVILHVFKGPGLSAQRPVPSNFDIGFQPGDTAAEWQKVFSGPAFSQILFLERQEERYVSTSYAEEGAGCESSGHVSWCPNYAAFRGKVEACLKPK